MNPSSISSASICCGRIMAVCSQLAALSAARRRSGQGDLDFSADLFGRLNASGASLDALCAVASCQLSDQEAAHLRLATAVKLLDLAAYRPYEVELSDCLFSKRAFDAYGANLGRANRQMVLRMYSGTAARLASKGRWAEARALLVRRTQVHFWSRFLVRKTLTPALHRRIHDLIDPVLSLARGA